MGFSIERCYDKATIVGLVDSCFTDIVEHGTPRSVIQECVDVNRHCWMLVEEGDDPVAVFEFKPYNTSLLEFHPYIPKKHRQRGDTMINMALEWFDSEAPETYESLITNVPSFKRYALWAANKHGFRKAGAFTGGFKTNTGTCDMVLLQRVRKWAV